MKAKRDANEPAIVQALEAAGCQVQPLSSPGVPDLLVWTGARYFLLEVKENGETFTPAQKRWHSTWRGPAHVVRSPDEALAIVNHARRG